MVGLEEKTIKTKEEKDCVFEDKAIVGLNGKDSNQNIRR